MHRKKRKNFIYCNSVAAHPYHLMRSGLDDHGSMDCYKQNATIYLYDYRKMKKKKNLERFEYD
jgi:hypothetical protein